MPLEDFGGDAGDFVEDVGPDGDGAGAAGSLPGLSGDGVEELLDGWVEPCCFGGVVVALDGDWCWVDEGVYGVVESGGGGWE